jgi:steroid 5-alpha reductase family enzyme
MSRLELFLLAGLAILLFNTALWLLSLRLKNSSIVDPVWAIISLIAAGVYFIFGEGFQDRRLLLLALVLLWSLRLSGYLAWRNWGEPEDFRYAKWRQEAGESWWWRSYLKVFVLQGAIAWFISTPFLVAMTASGPDALGIFDLVAVLVWFYGFFFEAMGDYQLARFKANPDNHGKVLDYGVWRYTRHPNYFGDAAQWWGFGILALIAGGWWTLYAPALMTYLLINISGVAMLERHMRKKEKYAAYIASTPVFIPWFPKKKA